MRYDPARKSETRERVLKAAARSLRVDGAHKLGVASVMAKAGLTHGGFYAHFASRDDLVTATLSRMFEDGHQRFELETQGKAPCEAFARYVEFYLSTIHRDARSSGCPLPYLSADAARLSTAARKRFASGVASLEAKLGAMLFAIAGEPGRAQAASVLAELVGALALARAEPDKVRSDTMLASSRTNLKARFGIAS